MNLTVLNISGMTNCYELQFWRWDSYGKTGKMKSSNYKKPSKDVLIEFGKEMSHKIGFSGKTIQGFTDLAPYNSFLQKIS